MKTMLLILIALLASGAVLTAQDARQGDSGQPKADDQQAQKAGDNSSSRPELQDAAPASPARSSSGASLLQGAGPANVEDAARKVAHDLATGPSGSGPKAGGAAKHARVPTKDASGSSTPSGIGEFHAVSDDTGRSSANPVVHKDGSGKRIHGELYGAGGPAARAGTESVGATSKGGKTSVYVQSDQAASTAAPPQ